MADESVSIVVTDKVEAAVSKKLKGIASDARTAGDAVKFLQSQLKSISASSGLSRLQSELAKTAVLQARLADQNNKTNTSYFNAEAALNRAIAAEQRAAAAVTTLMAAQARAATEAQRLATAQQQGATAAAQTATAQQNLATAQNNSLSSAQRLATATAQNAAAQTNSATATIRSATAATQSQTAQQNLASATQRVATAQTQGATAAQRLATEQQRTVVQTSNAATASDRAALAALRLAQAQERASGATSRAGNSLVSYLRQLAAIATVGISAHAILQMADSYTVLQNKLQNVTTSQAQVNRLTEELYELANRTRTGVDTTATAFARFDRSLKQMGKSQTDTLRLTETVNKALIVSGATTSEASSALLQLSQAFNAGRLQGDEFRAVAENMPIVLDAVAKVLGRPINEVKKLGTEGKITAKVLYDAFKLMEQPVDATFAKTVSTVGEALKVLGNNTSKFLGELNKATGFTTALNGVLKFIGDNLANIAGALAVVGTALLVYFGPRLIGALTLASRAMWAFTLAVAANPIGLLAVGAASALTAIVLFGDKIKVSSDGLITLKDVALSAWAFIKDGASVAATAVKNVWNGAIDIANEKTNGMGEPFRNLGSFILGIIKNMMNGVIGYFVGGYKAIESVWTNFPTLMKGFFYGAVNYGATALETLLNAWQTGLKFLAKATESLAPETSKALTNALDSIKIELPRLDTSGAKDAAKDVAKAFNDAMNTDYVGDAADAIMRRAKSFSVARNLEQDAIANAALRGNGANLLKPDADSKAAKAAEKRQVALARINAELNNEAARMFVLQPLREAQARYDQIEEALIAKRIKLTSEESAEIKGKIRALQQASVVQQKFDAIYEDANGPARDYNATLDAAYKLLSKNAISQAQYGTAVLRANEEFENAVDPMRQYNIGLQDQATLLNVLPGKRAVEQQMLALERETLAKGTPDRENYLRQKRQEITLLEERKAISGEVDKIYNETIGAQQSLVYQQTALNEAYAQGILNADAYLLRMTQLGVAQANLRLQMQEGNFADIMTGSLGMVVENYKGVLSGLRDSFGNFFTGLSDGFANSIGQALTHAKSLKEGLQDVARTGISQLIAGLVKLGIQWAINAALGNTIAATAQTAQLALTTSMAIATAAAWAPAAAAVSLATMGANSAPAMAGISATNALSQSMAMMAAFEKGGYTGNYGTKQVAGIVHGQEYVVNAQATARNRGLLESINNGGSVESYDSSGGYAPLSVHIYNYGNSTVTTQEDQGPNGRELKIFIQDVMTEDISAGGPMSQMFESQYQLNRANGINR